MICVVDYGVANLGSMLNMLRRTGVEAKVVAAAQELREATRIILPGVGAFDQGMAALEARNLVAPLRERARAGIPLLGVCLGMQLLGRGSEEGVVEGLGLLDARCIRLEPGADNRCRVPHMGWCQLAPRRDSPLLAGLGSDARFYFVHSYHMRCNDPSDELAVARYGIEFTAVVERGNIHGVQFHPEKSHRFGMKLLRNFANV